MKPLFKIPLNCVKFAFNFLFLGSVILHKLTITAFTDIHIFGLVRRRNMTYISN